MNIRCRCCGLKKILDKDGLCSKCDGSPWCDHGFLDGKEGK